MRKATPRGQMTRGNTSGPAVMLMPPDIRSTFMPNPPLEPVPLVTYRRKQKWSAVADYVVHLEKTPPPKRIISPTPKTISEKRKQEKMEQHRKELQPLVADYRKEQRDCKGEFKGINCYNTLFIGRLAYEVTERKLLREMESFGPVKDIQIIKHEGKSRGYAFVEYEHEEDMKRAYRAADGMRMDGREIVVDVERGHTVPEWLPRRLGGGLGGTRLGGREVNVTRPGRFDPNRPEQQQYQQHQQQSAPSMMAPSGGMGRGGAYGGGGGFGGGGGGPPPSYGMGMGRGADRYGGGGGPPPPRDWDRGRGGGGDNSRQGDYDRRQGDYDRNKRRRSRSPPPDQRYGGGGGARRGRY